MPQNCRCWPVEKSHYANYNEQGSAVIQTSRENNPRHCRNEPKLFNLKYQFFRPFASWAITGFYYSFLILFFGNALFFFLINTLNQIPKSKLQRKALWTKTGLVEKGWKADGRKQRRKFIKKKPKVMAVDEGKILLDWSRKRNWRILKEDAKKK